MACEQYTNGSSLNVQHVAATLPTNFCPDTWQDVISQIAQSLISTISGQYAAFTIGADAPSASDQDKLWFRLDPNNNCAPMGFFIYTGGSWRRATPHAVPPGVIVPIYLSALAALTQAQVVSYIETVLDMPGGVDDGNGAWWYLCDGNNGTPDLSKKFVCGAVGSDDGEASEYGQGVTGGEETHQLTRAELPEDLFLLPGETEGVLIKVASGTGGLSLGTGQNNYNVDASPYQPLNDQGHENRPPYAALFFIMKSTRLF